MPEFEVDTDDMRSILRWVHWMQTAWMMIVGTALLVAPRERFGHSYAFIVETPGLQALLAVLYLTSGTVLMFSLIHDWPKPMAKAMRLGGFINWAFAVLLFLGALRGPTGVLGPLFPMYVGAHMLIQSVLLKRSR